MQTAGTSAQLVLRSPYEHFPTMTKETEADAFAPQDVFTPSTPGEVRASGKGRTVAALLLMLAAGGVVRSCTTGGNPSPTAQQSQPTTIPVGNCWKDGEVIQGACSDRLGKMSPEGQNLYRSMVPGLKQWFAENVNGRAGPFGVVNKRESFIGGSWAGFNTFDFVNGRLDKRLKETKASPEEIKSGKKMSHEDIKWGKHINETCRRMTPDQRRAFVELLELDTGRKK